MVVVGKANVDYLVRGPRLPQPGESVNGEVFQQAPGGKGANQAVGAARLGATSALIARIVAFQSPGLFASFGLPHEDGGTAAGRAPAQDPAGVPWPR